MQLDGDAFRSRIEEAQVLNQDGRPRSVSVGRRLYADASAQIKTLRKDQEREWSGKQTITNFLLTRGQLAPRC